MSLNGLDNANVKEAHDAAVAEAGGWFLLKYVSRDEIDLLGRGTGGIVEIQNAIAEFEEPAPLFGFLRYRRRNVVIKYVPEGCSRLVQARVTVHFNAVAERFSPHDTELSIASSKELKDTKVSAACSLHTASESTSSSTSSLQKRRLMEIAEDAEEDKRSERQSIVLEEHLSSTKSPSITGESVPLPESLPTVPTSASYRSMISNLETSPPPPREIDPEIQPQSPSKTLDEGRKSTQSMRPDLHSLSSYGSNGKPKVKLGPRPSLDVGSRPNTSSATSQYRPVSAIPAGIKLFSRGSQKEKDRPKSHLPTDPRSMTISPPPNTDPMAGLQIPSAPARPHTSGGRPTTSSGISTKSAAERTSAAFSKTPTITPEKARLMKALELRKKREMALTQPTPISTSSNNDEGLKSPVQANNRMSTENLEESQDTLTMLDDMANRDDSAISFDASSTMKTDESDATRSDSYPVSPIGPSEQAESTRASSMSESTDETVQEVQSTKVVSREDKVKLDESKTIVAPAQKNITENSVDKVEERKVEDLLKSPPVPHSPLPSLVVAAAESLVVDFGPPERTMLTPMEPTEKTVAAQIHQDATEYIVLPNKSVLAEEVLVSEIEPTNSIEISKMASEKDPASIPTIVKLEIKEWKVPRSKFSVQNLKAAAEPPAVPEEPMPLLANESDTNTAPKSPVESTFSADTKRSLTEDDQRENSPEPSKRRKRKALVEPIRTDLNATDKSATNSEANFSSDDELMEELQSAVMEEAKPISVSKSPISPVFPSPKKKVGNRFSRAFSSPMRKESTDDEKLTPRTFGQGEILRSTSASAAYLNLVNQQAAQPLAKKANLGSGISQRIKALEKLSANAPGAAATLGTTAPSTGASTAFFSVRKGSVRGAPKSPSIADRANSLTQNSPTHSPSTSRESSPETFKLRGRSGSAQSPLNATSASPTPSREHSHPESISVTARIIRDPNRPFPKAELGKSPSDYAPLDLQQSPLVINHQKAVAAAPQPQKETILERRLSNSSRTTTKSRRSSMTIVRDLIKDGRSSFAEHRRSINLDPSASTPSVMSPGRSPSRPPSVHQSPAHQRPVSISSRLSSSSREAALSPPPTAGSYSSNDEKDKKPSRASRMIRRMSSSLSGSRKILTGAMSPTVREESEPPVGLDSRSLTSSHPSSYSLTPTIASTNIGDVNVQFPDSLLWKRRSVLLDSQGNLVLSPALASGNAKEKAGGGATRRFHLTEFRTPSIPDVEMQELPNSVVLDFVDGGGLQIACEDRAAQMQVLHVLQDAHRACPKHSR